MSESVSGSRRSVRVDCRAIGAATREPATVPSFPPLGAGVKDAGNGSPSRARNARGRRARDESTAHNSRVSDADRASDAKSSNAPCRRCTPSSRRPSRPATRTGPRGEFFLLFAGSQAPVKRRQSAPGDTPSACLPLKSSEDASHSCRTRRRPVGYTTGRVKRLANAVFAPDSRRSAAAGGRVPEAADRAGTSSCTVDQLGFYFIFCATYK